MKLLSAFEEIDYPNDIGPGVFDIHSPNIPSTESITQLVDRASQSISPHHLWVNPDCGLKTRSWDEVIPALSNMVKAANQLRQKAAVSAA